MAKKKRSTTSAAKTRTVYVTQRRTHRKKSGIAQIPAAGATVGLVMANRYAINGLIDNPNMAGLKHVTRWAIQPEQLKRDAIYATVGMVAGSAVKKFAPSFIKSPLGKIAKKIPKVI